MNTFTASNGVTIERKGVAALAVERPMTDRLLNINAERVVALRDFFRAERDEVLGRWRSPEHPNVICNEHDGAIFVTDERDGRQLLMRRGDEYPSLPEYTEAARAYFEAHPERKPWHDAKPGEVWVLTVDGVESAFYPSKSMDRVFTAVAPATGNPGMNFDWPEITAGRRIYPEVSDAD